MHVEKIIPHASARHASYQLAPRREDQSWRGEQPGPAPSQAESQVEPDLSVVPSPGSLVLTAVITPDSMTTYGR